MDLVCVLANVWGHYRYKQIFTKYTYKHRRLDMFFSNSYPTGT